MTLATEIRRAERGRKIIVRMRRVKSNNQVSESASSRNLIQRSKRGMQGLVNSGRLVLASAVRTMVRGR